MEPRLTKLNDNEILKYLGYRGQKLTPEIEEQMALCEKRVAEAAAPRLTYKIVEVKRGGADGSEISCGGVPLKGGDIRGMLEHCGRAVLVGATLGPDIERVLRRYEITNMADALIMDACASTAVENVVNNFENDMRAAIESEGFYLTERFSPGYGDLPLDTQKSLVPALEMEKRIGVSLSSSMLMIPRKSVTAIMGISDVPYVSTRTECEKCMMFRDCAFRKKGTTCHG